MKSLKIGSQTINLNFETQYGSLGRPFRLSGTAYNLKMPEKWINGAYKHHVIHTFIYLDEKGGTFDIELDYYEKVLKKS